MIADSEHKNKFVEKIDTLKEQIQKNKKWSDENAILDYLKKRANDINQEILSLGIASSSKKGIILNKPSSGINCYKINHNIT